MLYGARWILFIYLFVYLFIHSFIRLFFKVQLRQIALRHGFGGLHLFGFS